jgi:predicted nucleotidyltransferase
MKRKAAIDRLTRRADEIRSFGVARLYLFGSTARDSAGPKSDVDIFIDLDRNARFSLFDLMDLRVYLGRVLGTRVDVFSRDGLHRLIRRNVVREAIRVI